MPDDLRSFDRIVAADVLYEREYGPLVAEVVARLLAPDGLATIADPGRVAATSFVERCDELGLLVESGEEVPVKLGPMRQRIGERLGWLGIALDDARNANHATRISSVDARVQVLVIPTDEETVIAQGTARLLEPPSFP